MIRPTHAAPALSLVMPCYNEEDCLRETAGELLSVFAARQIPLQLVLVDNGSRDRTGEIIDSLVAEGAPVTKVTVAVNEGYGHGVLQGLKACTAPLVGYLCADGQVAAVEAVTTYEAARAATRPALAKVRRKFRKDSWRRKLVSVVYNLGMQCTFGWLGSIDLNASPKILPRDAYQAMELQSRDWFLDPELMIKAKHLGLQILERDVEGLLRRGGVSNVRYVTIAQFLKNILSYRFGARLRDWRKKSRALAADLRSRRAAVPSAGGGAPR